MFALRLKDGSGYASIDDATGMYNWPLPLDKATKFADIRAVLVWAAKRGKSNLHAPETYEWDFDLVVIETSSLWREVRVIS